jgi:hypothetical protein
MGVVYDTIVGGGAVCSFVIVWILSIFSLVSFPFALYYGWHFVTLPVLVAAGLDCIPNLPKLKPFRNHLFGALPRAFSAFSVNFEPGSTPAELGGAVLYAVHPHGIFSMTWAAIFLREQMKEVTWCYSPFLYWTPLFHLYIKLMGEPGRADKDFMVDLMRKKRPLALIPGGFEEATLTSGGDLDRVYIKKRAGFIKYCIQHGTSICPVFGFGEKKLWGNVQGLWGLRLWINKMGLPAIMPFAPLVCIPRREPLHVVVGTPFKIERNPNPTAEDVAAVHRGYMQALKQLYDRNKGKYYGPVGHELELEFW